MKSLQVPQNRSVGSTAAANLLPLPVAEQVRDLATALSLNKSQLARILNVTRATVDSWRRGGEPSATTVTRLRRLVSLLSLSSVSGTAPLNARFVRHPSKPGQASLIELLSEQDLAADAIAQELRAARALGEAAAQRTKERLRRRGFEEPDEATRRERLALNIALKEWPA